MREKIAGILPAGGGAKSDRWTRQFSIPPLGRDLAAHYDRLKQKLKIDQLAHDDGALGLPDKTDRDLNETQLRICNEIFSGIARLHQFLAAQFALAAQLMGEVKPPGLDEDLEKSRIDQLAARSLSEHRSELVGLKEHELEALLDLRYFRAAHRLQRAAVYRASPHGLISLLALLMLVESAFNGLLLRKISDQGWIGGIFIALLISAVNLALGLAGGGFGWRLIGHVKLGNKALGALIAVVCLATAFIWNLYIAHFREVAEIAAAQYAGAALPQAALDAWRHVRAQGFFGIHTMFSWALLLLGLGAHLLVSKEAWDHLADRYYDYMKVDRQYQRARDAFADAMGEVEDNSRAVMEDALENIDGVLADGGLAVAQARHVNEQAHQRHADILAGESEWVRQGEALLHAYREENRKVRHEGTSPAYFDQFPGVTDYRSGRFGEVAAQAELRGDLVTVEAKLAAFRDHVTAAEAAARENEQIAKRLRIHADGRMAKLGDALRQIETEVLQVADHAVGQRRDTPADSDRGPDTAGRAA